MSEAEKVRHPVLGSTHRACHIPFLQIFSPHSIVADPPPSAYRISTTNRPASPWKNIKSRGTHTMPLSRSSRPPPVLRVYMELQYHLSPGAFCPSQYRPHLSPLVVYARVSYRTVHHLCRLSPYNEACACLMILVRWAYRDVDPPLFSGCTSCLFTARTSTSAGLTFLDSLKLCVLSFWPLITISSSSLRYVAGIVLLITMYPSLFSDRLMVHLYPGDIDEEV